MKQLRKTRGARALRQWISEVQDSLRNGDASKFLNLSDRVEGLRKQMLLEFGLEKKEKEPSGLSVSLWIFSYSPQIPRWLHKGLYKFTSKAHVQFLYDNIKRSTTISSLMPDIARLFWPNTHQEEHFLFPHDDQNNDHHDLKPFDYSNYLKEESRNVQ